MPAEAGDNSAYALALSTYHTSAPWWGRPCASGYGADGLRRAGATDRQDRTASNGWRGRMHRVNDTLRQAITATAPSRNSSWESLVGILTDIRALRSMFGLPWSHSLLFGHSFFFMVITTRTHFT